MMRCPCYDSNLQQVCTSKSTYCRLSCEAYKQYENSKRKEYEDRKKQCDLSNDLINHSKGIEKRVRRRRHLGR